MVDFSKHLARNKKPSTKRRANRIAATPATSFVWQETFDGGYSFTPDATVQATLTPQGDKWLMLVLAGGKHYSGERACLEDAFKAIAHLLYKVARTYWLAMDARVVSEPWAHGLPEVTNVPLTAKI